MALSRKDSWLRDYEALVELGARVGVKIRERDQLPRGSAQASKMGSSVARQLQDYQRRLQTLKGSLHRLSTGRDIADSEYQRRKGMLEELADKAHRLQQAAGSSWDSVEPRSPTTGPGVAERLSVDEIRQQQQQVIHEQDEGLEHLSRALRRQQQYGLAIQEEVDEHNVLIDDIQSATSKADSKVRAQTRRVEEVRRKDSCKCTCVLWSIIILLAIAIIVIAVVPADGKN